MLESKQTKSASVLHFLQAFLAFSLYIWYSKKWIHLPLYVLITTKGVTHTHAHEDLRHSARRAAAGLRRR